MSMAALLEQTYPGKRAALKRRILECALLMFNAQGIESTTIEMIRDACTTSVGAIYHHFQNKEGIIAALFLLALDDQLQQREQALTHTTSLQTVVEAIVGSYIDWVDRYPTLAQFMFSARFYIQDDRWQLELKQLNARRNAQVISHFKTYLCLSQRQHVPIELLPSLIIGSTENYTRAWLSQKVVNSPIHYKAFLQQAAWAAVAPHFESTVK